MTVAIPIRPATPTGLDTSAAPGGIRLTLPLRFGTPSGTVALPVKSPVSAERIALAVAASVEDPADALWLARQARNKPDRALGQEIDPAQVADVVAVIRGAQDDPKLEFDISDPLRAAASAAGADPRLVAAAADYLQAHPSKYPPDPDPANNSPGWNSRRCIIALVDPNVIDRAVRAFLAARAVEIISGGEDVRSLQKKVDGLLSELAQLEHDEKDLKVRVEKLETGKSDGSKAKAPV
jgi:hypothetical protein